MRTSRVAKETARLFDATPHANTTGPDLPRRSTRASVLARFAYNATANQTPDIEDAVGSPRSSTSAGAGGGAVTRVTQKRKRAATVNKPSSSPPPTRFKPELPSDSEPDIKNTAADNKPAKPRRKPARRAVSPSGTVKVEPPSDWEEMYALAKAMRLTGPAANAAVDTMGCERLAAPDASPHDRRFHTLIALMLSSQTKDTVNAAAMRRLQTELPAAQPGGRPGLTLENILAVEDAVLNELIGKVGFHNNKTRYIKQAAVILRDQWGGDIPNTIEGLMALPGVGPKMAHLCMSAENGWNRVEGIGVDVHVHRITNLWGWQNPPTKTPEDTRLALQAWLPRDKWKEINWLLVGLGQAVCLPVGRKCGDCDLGLKGLCKAADRKKVAEGRRKVKLEEVKVELEAESDGQAKLETKTEVAKMEIDEDASDSPGTVEVNESGIKKSESERPHTKSIKREGRVVAVKREAKADDVGMGDVDVVDTKDTKISKPGAEQGDDQKVKPEVNCSVSKLEDEAGEPQVKSEAEPEDFDTKKPTRQLKTESQANNIKLESKTNDSLRPIKLEATNKVVINRAKPEPAPKAVKTERAASAKKIERTSIKEEPKIDESVQMQDDQPILNSAQIKVEDTVTKTKNADEDKNKIKRETNTTRAAKAEDDSDSLTGIKTESQLVEVKQERQPLAGRPGRRQR